MIWLDALRHLCWHFLSVYKCAYTCVCMYACICTCVYVHLYGLHVYCALVDLDSSGSPGVRPTPGLTSSIQVVCVCVRAYISTHPPTTWTPARIEKYTRQTSYLYPCQNIASHASNKFQPWAKYKKIPLPNPFIRTHVSIKKQFVIHTHVVERLFSTNKQNALTRVYMYTHMRVYIHVYAYLFIDIHVYIYIQSTFVYIYAGLRVLMVWANYPFSF